MKLYVCCPHSECGAYQKSLSFLHSYGIEPALEIDDDGEHYLEFPITKRTKQNKELCLELSKRTNSPFCRCWRFFDGKGGNVIRFRHKETKETFSICEKCAQYGRITPEEIPNLLT